MKLLRILGGVLGIVIVLAAVLYPFRRDPIAIVAGKKLTGSEAAYPTDWSFSDDQETIAVEVRPDDPHSVTTVCFVYDGVLHVPAQKGSEKQWTAMALDDPRVRVKVGGTIYPGRAVRVVPDDPAPYMAALAKKYAARLGDGDAADRELPPDVWLFRIEPREAREG